MTHADFDFGKIEKTAQDSVKSNMFSRDMALPMISFMTGKKVKKFFKDKFKEDHLEDVWINSLFLERELNMESIIHCSAALR